MPSDFQRLSRLLSLSAEGRTITNIGNAATDFTTDGGITYADDALVRIGADGDGVSVLNSAGLAINTPLTSVLIGTPVTPVAIAANSVIKSNITASGDYLIAVNKAGTSHMAFMADASTGDTLLGAPTGQSIDGYIAGTKVLDIAANVLTYQASLAAGTRQLLVSNTSNTADASHAQIWASVGGGTSTGDPAFILEVLSSSQWTLGADNSQPGDPFTISDGLTPGISAYFQLRRVAQNETAITLSAPSRTTTGGANVSNSKSVETETRTITISNNTATPLLVAHVDIQALTLAQSGGLTPVVDKATGHASIPVTAGAGVTLTISSAYRALTGGANVNAVGFFAEAQTGGTNGNYQILMVNGGTQPVALADHVGMGVIDFAGGDARLYINAELGSSIIIGNNALEFTAADGRFATSSAGVARSITSDITIAVGGAANAVLQHAFHLDSVIEAGLLGETDGSGSYTQAKSVWKIPYRDAAAGAIGPTAPTTAATWNGGLSIQTSDAVPNGRLYWMANETQHYVDATAGFSYLYKEPTIFGNWNHDGIRPWQYGDLMALKVDKYAEDGGHALPYPFDQATKEVLLRLLEMDAEFIEHMKERMSTQR